jgi:hypothetical protein
MKTLARLVEKRASRSNVGPSMELEEHGKTIQHALNAEKAGKDVKPTQVAKGIAKDHGKEIADATHTSVPKGEKVYYEALPKFEEILKEVASIEADMIKLSHLEQDKEGYKLVSKKDPAKVLKRWDHKPSLEAVKHREDQIEMFKAMDKEASARKGALMDLQKPVYSHRQFRRDLLKYANANNPELMKDIMSHLTDQLTPKEKQAPKGIQDMLVESVQENPNNWEIIKTVYPNIFGKLTTLLQMQAKTPQDFVTALVMTNFNFPAALAKLLGVPYQVRRIHYPVKAEPQEKINQQIPQQGGK